MFKLVFFVFLLCLAGPANAAQMGSLDLTYTLPGVIVLTIFVIAYVFVIGEEFLHIRKSKPMLLAAGIIWIALGWIYTNHGIPIEAEEAFNHNLLEYAQLLLFLLVAMTYINAMEERGIFDRIRVWMLSKGMSLRSLFWLTGILAFLISSFANNLTTAMLMCAIVLKVAHDNPKFINIACINIVVAANAGGVFSPFGDITTLMIWQAGLVKFEQFIVLFVPAVVNFMVPALIMSFFISNSKNAPLLDHDVTVKRGAKRIILMFFFTIATAVMCHSWLSMPPVLGMMLGLGYLQLLGFYLRFTLPKSLQKKRDIAERNNDEAA